MIVEGPLRSRAARRSSVLVRSVLVVFSVLAPAIAFAQNSSIAGLVRDSSGGVLPGVSVEAASPTLIEKVRTAVTDAQGRYSIIDLRPGTYSVTFTLAGFNTFKRDGIDLPGGFTATVNADLTVGGLEESLTVTGAAPLVDVQRTSSQAVISKELLAAVPTTRLVMSYTGMIPGVQTTSAFLTPLANTPAYRTLSVHGSRDVEHNTTVDGFSMSNMGNSGGSSDYYNTNPGTAAEVVVQTGGAGAEYQMAGLVTNMVPKEGGNRFSGSTYFHYVNASMVGDNLTDEQRAKNLGSGIRKLWDFNPGIGGPIKQDKLWFFFSYRTSGQDADSGVRYNATPTAWVYTPDLSQPNASIRVTDRNYSTRLTWQLSPRNKIGIVAEDGPKYWFNRTITATLSPEASTWSPYTPMYFAQIVWRSPRTNRFLLEAGTQVQNNDLKLYPNTRASADFSSPVSPDLNAISASESTTGIRFRSSNSLGNFGSSESLRSRASAAYVTGTHSFKAAMELRQGTRHTLNYTNQDISYRMRNGVPDQLTLYSPNVFGPVIRLKADLGLSAQDSWTIRHVTLNYGVRYDYLNAYNPAQCVQAGRFLPQRCFDEVVNVPNWHDMVPRFGIAYDLFGNGRTALKGTFSKYVVGQGIRIAQDANPVNTSVVSATRTWTDTNGNFVPDCNLLAPAANGECGVLSNLAFGQNNTRARGYDPDWLHGWGKRDFNRVASVAIQHELVKGLSVNAEYFRRWYGNFPTIDNLAVTSADFNPFCVTLPVDSRLPNGGGYQQCGYYDVTPAKQGLTQELVTMSTNVGGHPYDHFNGVDLGVSARFRNGVQMSGGTSTGRSEVNTCYVVDSPQSSGGNLASSGAEAGSGLLFCDNKPPFLTNVKFIAVYPLPWWSLQASAAYLNIPGPQISADYVATNAEVRQTLGRNLSAGANATVTLPIIPPGTLYAPRTNKLDVRFTKNLTISQKHLQVSLDIFNITNSNAVVSQNSRYGPSWLDATGIIPPRYFRFATQIDF